MKALRKMVTAAIALCLVPAAVWATAGRTLEGDANVDQRNYPSTVPFIHPPFYNVRLAVDVDENGVITAVRDNGTGGPGSVQSGNEEFWAAKNKPFFDAAVKSGLLERFVGKTLEEVRAMDMSSGGVDAVSGATMVSAAAQEAVINAFEGKSGKAFLEAEGPVMPVLSVEGAVITLRNALPDDFDLQVLDIRRGVRNEDVVPADSYTVGIAGDTVTIAFRSSGELKPGLYYVNVIDAGGRYRSPSFEGGPAASEAPYFVVESGIAAEDLSFDGEKIVLRSGNIADYIRNIRRVEILAEGEEKAVVQEIVGHHGTAADFIVLDENGVLNADGVVKARSGEETALFGSGRRYTVTVSSFGYPDLAFSFARE